MRKKCYVTVVLFVIPALKALAAESDLKLKSRNLSLQRPLGLQQFLDKIYTHNIKISQALLANKTKIKN